MNYFLTNLIENDPRATLAPVLRFPPEPNGYLHLGHARAIVLNFSYAKEHGGHCNLRLDDTNPDVESLEYAESIASDVAWLGFTWHGGKIRHASEWMDVYVEAIIHLIRTGKAFVDTSSAENVRVLRGTWDKPGVESSDKYIEMDEHMLRFRYMLEGTEESSEWTVRANIDMSSSNMNLRDPILMRRKFGADIHNRKWNVFPMYDFAHPISDAMEGIVFSLCTLEFEDHRPLYDWVIEHTRPVLRSGYAYVPRQIEFARMEVSRGVTSKRKISGAVTNDSVNGWSDPRLLTLAGLRERGFTPESIRLFCERHPPTRANATIPIENLVIALRDSLDATAPRRSVVIHPVKAEVRGHRLTNGDIVEMPEHPKFPERGNRTWTWTDTIWIARDDIRRTKEPGFKRVYPGSVVRLMHGGIVRCLEVEVDNNNVPTKVIFEYVENVKPAATLHWLPEDAGECKVVEWDFWDGESDPELSRKEYVARAEKACWTTDDTWHGLRTGYFYTHDEGILYKTCSLNG